MMSLKNNEVIKKEENNDFVTYNIFDGDILRMTVSKIKNPKVDEDAFFGKQMNTNKVMMPMPNVFYAEKCWQYYNLEHHKQNMNHKNNIANILKESLSFKKIFGLFFKIEKSL